MRACSDGTRSSSRQGLLTVLRRVETARACNGGTGIPEFKELTLHQLIAPIGIAFQDGFGITAEAEPWVLSQTRWSTGFDSVKPGAEHPAHPVPSSPFPGSCDRAVHPVVSAVVPDSMSRSSSN